MLPDLDLLNRLQGADLRIEALRRELLSLPKQIAAIEQALAAHKTKLEADKLALAAAQKDHRQFELDIQTHQQKASKLKEQMMSAKNNEQYRAFQHEIEFCENAVAQVEERIASHRSVIDGLAAQVKAAEAELESEKAVVEKRKAEARAVAAADQAKGREMLAERDELVKQLPPKAAALYTRLTKRFPNPISEAHHGRCTACQLEVRPALMQQVRKQDAIHLCENCGRVLFYNPAVEVDAGPAQSPSSGSRSSSSSSSRSGRPFSGGTRVDMS